MTPKRPLAIGDRVRVYESALAPWNGSVYEIGNIGGADYVGVEVEGKTYQVHPRQCVRLKVKPKKRPEKWERVEAYCARFDGDKLGGLYLSKENAEAWLSTVASCHKEIVHLVELRSGEVLIDQKREMTLTELRPGQIPIDRKRLATAFGNAMQIYLPDQWKADKEKIILNCFLDHFGLAEDTK